MKFEWNSEKALSNIQKHGVTFEEASTVFADPLSVTIQDPLHSLEEERSVTIGYSYRNRLLVIVHTDRENRIRIISARKATGKERQRHEENG